MAYGETEHSPNVRWVLAWTERMSKKHGGIVRGVDGTTYDWGQALARERYGPDWMDSVPDAPTDACVSRASRWENGDWPDWVAHPTPAEASRGS